MIVLEISCVLLFMFFSRVIIECHRDALSCTLNDQVLHQVHVIRYPIAHASLQLRVIPLVGTPAGNPRLHLVADLFEGDLHASLDPPAAAPALTGVQCHLL